MRFVLMGGLAVVLAGCVLPPAVAIGTYAADGLSYLITGKSVSDHAISEVVGEDCATWRMLKLENPCRPYEDEDGDVVIAEADAETAALEPVEEGPYDQAAPVVAVTEVPIEPRQAALSFGAVERIEPAAGGAKNDIATEPLPKPLLAPLAEPRPLAAAPAGPAAVEPAVPAPDAPRPAGPGSVSPGPVGPGTVAQPTISAVPPGGHDVFLVMASFSRKSNAVRLAERHAAFTPVVVPARLGGRTFYRVVTRVDRRKSVDATRRRLAKAGFRDSWLLEVCAETPAAGCLAWNGGAGGVEVAVLR